MATVVKSPQKKDPNLKHSSSRKGQEVSAVRSPRKSACPSVQKAGSGKSAPGSPRPKTRYLMSSGNRIYECVVCRRAFSCKETLQRHFLIHRGDRVRRCKTCKKSSSWSATIDRAHNYGLTSRAVGHVVPVGIGPFQCEVCPSLFHLASDLRKHMTTHEEESLLQCIICGKFFAHESSILRHIEMHPGDRPYRCDMCGKAWHNPLNAPPPAGPASSPSSKPAEA